MYAAMQFCVLLGAMARRFYSCMMVHAAQPGGQAQSAVQALDLDIVPESQSI